MLQLLLQTFKMLMAMLSDLQILNDWPNVKTAVYQKLGIEGPDF